MVLYTPAQLSAFADAMAENDRVKSPGYLVIDGFMADYKNLRDADAECWRSIAPAGIEIHQ